MSNKGWIGAGIGLLAVVAAAIALFGAGGGPSSGSSRDALLYRPHIETTGAPVARVHIVEFLDPACETCAVFYPRVKELMARHPERIKLSVRHVAFHKGADFAVRALEAARSQGKYWQALEALLASQPVWAVDHVVQPEFVLRQLGRAGLDLARLQADMADPTVVRNVRQDDADATALRVMKTPEYFVNGRRMETFGLRQLQALVEEEVAARYSVR